MSKDHILPCPFCGASLATDVTLAANDCRVLCLRCGARGPCNQNGWYWNTRSSYDSTSDVQAEAPVPPPSRPPLPELIYVPGRTFWDWLAESGDSRKTLLGGLMIMVTFGVSVSIIAALVMLAR